MKFQLLLMRTALAALVFTTAITRAQTCGTKPPSDGWEKWFGAEVDAYAKRHASSKTTLVKYQIPIIVHIIHFGEAYGTFPNIDSNQVKSAVSALNADFAGIGTNAS